MKNKKSSFVRRVVVSLAVMPLLVSVSHAEKSMWQKFKDFFTPGETIECEGSICEELHDLESKINKTEGKYSRERRPIHKERYKKELDSLNVVRDSLEAVVKGLQKADSLKAASPSVSSSSATETAVQSSANSSSSVTVQPAMSCKPDTVFVRDTVVVHDTLYVVVTSKPAETSSEKTDSSTSDSTSADAIKKSENLK